MAYRRNNNSTRYTRRRKVRYGSAPKQSYRKRRRSKKYNTYSRRTYR